MVLPASAADAKTPSPTSSASESDRPPYRGRFAPSPTGPLHFGSLIAALASYCDARIADGQWLVRVEDVDLPRTRPGAEDAILSTLERYGFAWDGPVTRQRKRGASYEAALERLVASGAAYRCTCTRRELGSASQDVGSERVYPGTCRNGIAPHRANRAQQAWRIRVGDESIVYDDRLFGPQSQVLSRDVGDFVLRRADGLFAYQLAVVVDDAAQGITDVVRGADLSTSTPRQIFLQQALGYPRPSYLHVPIAVNAAGQKLSKQTRAAPLPVSPLPALLAAWSFLIQPVPFAGWHPANVAEFWTWATVAWTPSRVPPVPMLPAAETFGSGLREPV